MALSGFYQNAGMVFLVIALLFTGQSVRGQERPNAPVADVFEVMELATADRMDALWPGFKASETPALVFDGLNTYLFHSGTIPDGFVRGEKDPGVLVYKGQHPQVRGNSVVRLGETWTATSVLGASSRRTGEKYSLRDMAGIIVHEQFHVFQRTCHSQWRQNDGVLLRYPDETAEALFERRREKEAFKRAVVSDRRTEMAGWASLAWQCREERLGRLAAIFVQYEKELQRTEGLSDYIERIARGLDPLNASTMTNGIAPAGVRDLGYVEGRWIAMILDNLRSDWKSILEKNDGLYLEDILKTAVAESSGETKAFGGAEIDSMRAAAESDFVDWRAKKRAEIEAYAREPGFRLEIHSSADPLFIRMFEPLEMEILDDGGVFHKIFFSAANKSGSVRIMNHPCLTWFNDTLGVIRLSINGLKQAPEVIEGERKLIMNVEGVSVELKYTTLSVQDALYRLEL